MKKKLVSAFLVLVMVLCLMPVTALASDAGKTDVINTTCEYVIGEYYNSAEYTGTYFKVACDAKGDTEGFHLGVSNSDDQSGKTWTATVTALQEGYTITKLVLWCRSYNGKPTADKGVMSDKDFQYYTLNNVNASTVTLTGCESTGHGKTQVKQITVYYTDGTETEDQPEDPKPDDPKKEEDDDGTTLEASDYIGILSILGGGSKFSFDDVDYLDYYYDAVKWAVDSGVTSGINDTHFSPDGICTRAQAVTFLWRAAGSPQPYSQENSFTDVKPDDYFYDAVLWAAENGITNGLTSTTFGPDEAVTRAQVVAYLWRAHGQPAASASGFADVSSSDYYAAAVDWAYSCGITTGLEDGKFCPDTVCTRAQIVTFIWRAQTV